VSFVVRGCLGLRIRALIAHYAEQADIFVPEANVTEAVAYVSDLAR
jgi:hypothetical protein